MMQGILFAVVALILLGALLRLLREPGRSVSPKELDRKLQIEELFPLHCRHFPQVRQVFLAADREFIARRASRQLLKQWRAERNHVTRQFLAGLREDFSRLNQLARAVARLAPEVSRRQEAELFLLSVRFHVLHRLVALRLLTGTIALPHLTRLADLVGSLAVQVEAGMAELGEPSAARLRSSFSA